VKLHRGEGRPLVIAHRGASAAAPDNSPDAFAAAVAAGADLVELDVAPGLVVAHSLAEAPPDALQLDDALALLAPHPVGLHLDVKLAGYEREVLEAVARHGLGERVILSTSYAGIARRLASLSPDLPLAIGYPRDRLGVSRFRWPAPITTAGAAALRRAMPARIPLLLRVARASALALHHTLCSPGAVATAHRLGVPVLAWPVNDPAAVTRVVAAGVDGIVSDDPGMARETLATLIEP
jgi:glycerophosphoryl diester phosphodiesterase